VAPGLVEPGEKIMPRHDQHASSLQPLVQLSRRDRESRKPEPEEERPLGFMNPVVDAGEVLANPRERLTRLSLVERTNHRPAEIEDLAGSHQVEREIGPEARGREGDDRVERSDRFHDLLARHDDPRPHTGKPQLRKAHGEDHVLVPHRLRVGEENAGKGRAVRVVDDERYPLFRGERAEPL
jgi:hypothetical protein